MIMIIVDAGRASNAWSRTNGVNANGAAANVMIVDRLIGEKKDGAARRATLLSYYSYVLIMIYIYIYTTTNILIHVINVDYYEYYY